IRARRRTVRPGARSGAHARRRASWSRRPSAAHGEFAPLPRGTAARTRSRGRGARARRRHRSVQGAHCSLVRARRAVASRVEVSRYPVFACPLCGLRRCRPRARDEASCMSVIQQFFKEHGISEVEAIIPDMAGVARGKIMPAEKFAEEEGMRLPESIFLQTVTGEYPDDDRAISPSEIDIVLKADPN